jgi:hypothetical protein
MTTPIRGREAAELSRLFRQMENSTINPWHICDGNWGGFGPQLWVRAEGFGFAKGDVIERAFVNSDRAGYLAYEWRRVWIDSAHSWRDLTVEEIARINLGKTGMTG